jgi:penicillin V acylase-like amidase (Ntn superfamily)
MDLRKEIIMGKLFRRRKIIPMLFLLGATICGLVTGSDPMACSDMIAYGSIDKNRWVVSGRTLAYGTDVSGNFLYHVPAGRMVASAGSDGKTGLEWSVLYSFMGVDALGMGEKKFMDGMNDQGLSAAALWMQDGGVPVTATGPAALELSDVVGWILGTQKSVKEFAQAVQNVKIWYSKAGDSLPSPVHIVVHDETGQSLVLEWANGEMALLDEKVYAGVLTNEPHYTVQLMNLLNYKGLSNQDTADPDVPDGWLLGGGMLGMGGDQGSMSRFVRLFLLRKHALQIVNEKTCFGKVTYGAAWSVQQAFHIMNRVSGVHGEMVHTRAAKAVYPHTVLTLVRDHVNRKLYYRGYKSLAISYAGIPAGGGTQLMTGVTPVDAMEDHLGDLDVEDGSNLPSASTAIDDTGKLSMTIEIPVPLEGQGKVGKMYVFARKEDGSILSWNGRRWVPKGNVLASCWRGKLEPQAFDVFKDQDMAPWKGVKFYAGHGAGEAEMFVGGTFGLVYHVAGEINQDDSPDDPFGMTSDGL